MSTLTLANGTQRRWEGHGRSAGFQLYNKVDFSKTGGGSGDTVQMLTIPSGTIVLAVAHIVDTAEGGTSTGTIGDGTDPNGWIASVNNNATAGTALFSNAAGTLTAGTVDQKLIAGASAGDHTVTGVASGDHLVGVMHYTAGTSLADLTSEFTISGANTINNDTGTDTSSDQLLVTWQTESSFADDNAIAAAGGKYYASSDTIDMVLSANAVDTAVIKMVAWCVEVDV